MQCSNFALNLKGFTQIVPLPETKHFQDIPLEKMGVKNLEDDLGVFKRPIFSVFRGLDPNPTEPTGLFDLQGPRRTPKNLRLLLPRDLLGTRRRRHDGKWPIPAFRWGKDVWAKCLDDWMIGSVFYFAG